METKIDSTVASCGQSHEQILFVDGVCGFEIMSLCNIVHGQQYLCHTMGDNDDDEESFVLAMQ